MEQETYLLGSGQQRPSLSVSKSVSFKTKAIAKRIKKLTVQSGKSSGKSGHLSTSFIALDLDFSPVEGCSNVQYGVQQTKAINSRKDHDFQS
jgi:hypothetical protein